MDSSGSSLSSDWDIVNSASVVTEEKIEETPEETCEWVNEEECPPMGSGVDDINDADISNQIDSNSSSDIDIIEETAEDLIKMAIPSMEYSINSSISVDSSDPPSAPVRPASIIQSWKILKFLYRFFREPQAKDCVLVMIVSLLMTIALQITSPQDKVREMKQEVAELKRENSNLRKHLISSKIEDDKLFNTLEEQIKAMRSENQKLSGSLQLLISQMEEQTAILREENEARENDPYQEEIDKLKEQVNILQIDNDYLQKQLVRMRYGAYAQNSDSTQDKEQKEKAKKGDDMSEKVFDTITENIEHLKKRLYSEVGDLKEWKESIYNLIKRLNDKESRDEKDRNTYDYKEDKFRKHSKDEKHKKPDKSHQFYYWSWEDVKKNFKDKFDNINMSDMFSKYTTVNKKKVKGYFESMNHYFKKAQEKTKNILNFKEKGKNEVWGFLGELRKKWTDMRNEFFNRKTGPVPPDGEHKKGKHSDFSDKKSHFNKPEMIQNSPRDEEYNEKLKNILNDPEDPEFMFKLNSILESKFGPDWRAEMEKLFEGGNLKDAQEERSPDAFEEERYPDAFEEERSEDTQDEDEPQEAEGSWMFNRAEGRSNLRDHDNQEESTNWFLRKKKSAKGDFDVLGN